GGEGKEGEQGKRGGGAEEEEKGHSLPSVPSPLYRPLFLLKSRKFTENFPLNGRGAGEQSTERSVCPSSSYVPFPPPPQELRSNSALEGIINVFNFCSVERSEHSLLPRAIRRKNVQLKKHSLFEAVQKRRECTISPSAT
ncbi:MAG: hypothetical protein O7D30_03670, partial [Rickettsia endosymbiont of Ixodes persulcatus]|nr:hypothetical protein [Rickettsia endosymbiont of Ixodes persulcatus]